MPRKYYLSLSRPVAFFAGERLAATEGGRRPTEVAANRWSGDGEIQQIQYSSMRTISGLAIELYVRLPQIRLG
jgi:hypothetical protein